MHYLSILCQVVVPAYTPPFDDTSFVFCYGYNPILRLELLEGL